MPGDELTDRDRAADGLRALAGTIAQASAMTSPNGAQAAPASTLETESGAVAAEPGSRTAAATRGTGMPRCSCFA